jgi:hypothetical protein
MVLNQRGSFRYLPLLLLALPVLALPGNLEVSLLKNITEISPGVLLNMSSRVFIISFSKYLII